MQIAMVARLREERLEEYLELHRAVPIEVQEAMARAGIRNFVEYQHGLQIFATFEVDDFAVAEELLAVDPYDQAWQKRTAPCFAEPWSLLTGICVVNSAETAEMFF